jgi:hypothetical protein
MKFRELRPKIDVIYIDLRFPPCGRINEFNTESDKYDEFDVLSISSERRLTVYLERKVKK